MIRKGKYRHYKNGKLYEVIGTARHTETNEELVVYRGLYECETYGSNPLWVRPLKMFLEMINRQTPRFKLIDEDAQ